MVTAGGAWVNRRGSASPCSTNVSACPYTAVVNGSTISFIDRGGRVVRLRCARGVACRSLTAALSHALCWNRWVRSSGEAVNVGIDYRGRRLTPTAFFVGLVSRPGFRVVGFDSNEPEAVRMAQAVLAGDYTEGTFLGWLRRHRGLVL
jgi:hypothetical protein